MSKCTYSCNNKSFILSFSLNLVKPAYQCKNQLSPAPPPPPATAFLSLSRPPLRFVMFARSRFVSVRVQNYRLALSKLAENSDASLKFEFSKSASLISALLSLALPKLQSLAMALIRSMDIMLAPMKVDFEMLLSRKFEFFKLESLKLQLCKVDW